MGLPDIVNCLDVDLKSRDWLLSPERNQQEEMSKCFDLIAYMCVYLLELTKLIVSEGETLIVCHGCGWGAAMMENLHWARGIYTRGTRLGLSSVES